MPELTIAEIARLVDGEVIGHGDALIRGVAPVETAGSDHISFVANPRYLPYLQHSHAGAILVTSELGERVPDRFTRVVVGDAHLALYRLLPRLYPQIEAEAGVHSSAVVHPTAEIGGSVHVEAQAVVGPGVKLGEGCRIGAGTVIGADCIIGAQTVLHPQVTLYHGVRVGARCVIHSGARLGRQGFGFVWVDGGHRKVPQVGGCVIEDDVEVGNNVTIDRGSIGDTVVGQGTKIDSLVHLGHNVRVGRHVILVAQVGVAGSTHIGDGAVLGGQAGIGGHLEIGAGARIGAQGGVTADVPAGETYSGYPARPHRDALRAQGAMFRLPELMKRVKALEQAIFGSRV
ncbi:UDP-3-O-(3-hydroxymyristoyl)glucosamine N-acyltransferase [soil metagenome]